MGGAQWKAKATLSSISSIEKRESRGRKEHHGETPREQDQPHRGNGCMESPGAKEAPDTAREPLLADQPAASGAVHAPPVLSSTVEAASALFTCDQGSWSTQLASVFLGPRDVSGGGACPVACLGWQNWPDSPWEALCSLHSRDQSRQVLTRKGVGYRAGCRQLSRTEVLSF